MLGGYRLFVAAAVVCLIALSGSAQEQEDRNAGPQPNRAVETRQSRAEALPLSFQDARQLGGYRADCREPKDREDSDLCAQWGAVEAVRESNQLALEAIAAAQRSNALSRQGLYLTASEFLALVATFIFTAWAALAASRAAKAAAESLALSRRGYLFPEHVSIKRVILDYKDGTSASAFNIEVHCRNLGNAPAQLTHIVIGRRFLESMDDPENIDWKDVIPGGGWTSNVGPNVSFAVGNVDLSMKEAKELFARKDRFFFRLRIDYKSIFDKQTSFHTSQGYEVAFASNPGGLGAGPDLSDLVLFTAYHPGASAS